LRSGSVNLADAKRAIDAAQGDLAKADVLIDDIKTLTKFEKQRAVQYAMAHPDATVEKIIKDAKKPRFEETIILNLPLNVSEALKAASEKLAVDVEMLTINALTDWLKLNDYLTDAK